MQQRQVGYDAGEKHLAVETGRVGRPAVLGEEFKEGDLLGGRRRENSCWGVAEDGRAGGEEVLGR